MNDLEKTVQKLVEELEGQFNLNEITSISLSNDTLADRTVLVVTGFTEGTFYQVETKVIEPSAW
jgi:hypothetical protein